MFITPKARIHLLPALSSPIVVVLRRKPAKRFHVIAWNTDTNTLEYGTLFEGKLFVERCDVSPDGQYLAYMAIGRDGKVWTGVSRVPFLAALTHLNQDDTYFGGGLFTATGTLQWTMATPEATGTQNNSRAAVALKADIAQLERKLTGWLPANRKEKEEYALLRKKMLAKKRSLYNMDPNKPVKLPFATEQHLFTNTDLIEARFERDGWLREGKIPELVKTNDNWIVTNDPGWSLPLSSGITLRCFYEGYMANGGYQYRFSIDQYPDLLKEGVSWACRDSKGSLIVARNGALEKYSLKDITLGKPSFSIDLENLTPPAKLPKNKETPKTK